jgi:hypothetical protein
MLATTKSRKARTFAGRTAKRGQRTRTAVGASAGSGEVSVLGLIRVSKDP